MAARYPALSKSLQPRGFSAHCHHTAHSFPPPIAGLPFPIAIPLKPICKTASLAKCGTPGEQGLRHRHRAPRLVLVAGCGEEVLALLFPPLEEAGSC
uniref:Uncharacterized protein n=1 Tax=Oryza barthii TaxID=65489 RepID=A0A0D3H5D6_9ORYZ